ncbi:MAG TPA: hypothetical protein VF590_24135, partial [Isosphaeraceae bacterium]
AVAAMYALMRSWGVSRSGSGLSALAYGFGAPVLFQYCNVIFLVGAAWAPLGLRAADRLLRLGRRPGLVELATVLTLQVLGGDPQAAYVTALCAGGYAAGLAWAGRTAGAGSPGRSRATVALLVLGWLALTGAVAVEFKNAAGRLVAGPPGARSAATAAEVLRMALPPAPRLVLLAWGVVGLVVLGARRGGWRAGLRPRLLALAGACGLALALTAVQLLPALEFTGQTVRAAEQGPHEIYPFSLEPYRVVELVWPNVFGVTFEENRCWLYAIPPRIEHKIWVPSLYLGGLTLVLALAAFGFRGGPPWRAWLSAIALGSLLAAFGQFGSPLWWARCVPAWTQRLGPHDPEDLAVRADGLPRDGDGGPYWLIARALPGFHSFRYPSKLLVFTSLALAGLAGVGWDRVRSGASRRRARGLAGVLLGLSLAALAVAVLEADRLVAAFSPLAGSGTAFGPFQPRGMVRELQRALVHGAVVLAAAWPILRLTARRPALAGAGALALTAADLAVANAPFVRTVPQADLDQENRPWVLRLIEQAERKDPAPGPYRVHRMPIWSPPTWLKVTSADRVRDFVLWERGTIQPKYAIPYGLQYTLTEGTAELYDYWWFFGPFLRRVDAATARALEVEPGAPVVYFPRRGFDLWTTRYFVVPVFPHGWADEDRGYAAFLPETTPIYPDPDAFEGPGGADLRRRWIEQDVQIFRNEAAYPRAWVVHEARRLRPIVGLAKADRDGPMNEILYQNDALWHDPSRPVFDPRQLAWIETDDVAALSPYLTGSPPGPSESVAVTAYGPQRIELEARLDRPGLVVLADVFYPGWTLTIDGHPAPILRANRLMRGAAVAAGTHRLVYTYRPDSV